MGKQSEKPHRRERECKAGECRAEAWTGLIELVKMQAQKRADTDARKEAARVQTRHRKYSASWLEGKRARTRSKKRTKERMRRDESRVDGTGEVSEAKGSSSEGGRRGELKISGSRGATLARVRRFEDSRS